MTEADFNPHAGGSQETTEEFVAALREQLTTPAAAEYHEAARQFIPAGDLDGLVDHVARSGSQAGAVAAVAIRAKCQGESAT